METNDNKPLSPNEILTVLNQAEMLPSAALEAASACREAMAPLFLDAFDKYLALSPEDCLKAETGAVFYGFHLLGEWREKSAYHAMARLLHIPQDEAEVLFGDAATETVYRVMASVFDGNTQPVVDIILDGKAYDSIRSIDLASI